MDIPNHTAGGIRNRLRLLRGGILLFIMGWLMVLCACRTPAPSTGIAPGSPALDQPPWRPSGIYHHKPITESSGVAISRQYPGVYWTLNDSGNPPVLYATNPDGSLIREYRVKNAQNFDWEALALDDQGQLWIGDIGDNLHVRRALTLYVVPEPNPRRDREAGAIRRYRYRYPKGRVDAEGVFIYQGRPHIISKEKDRAVLYRFTELDPDGVHTLEKVGTLDNAENVTGADISPDGMRLAVCTYRRLWVYHGGKKLKDRIDRKPWTLLHNFSPEAVGFIGKDLLLTNEAREIYRIPAWWYERELPFPPKSTHSLLTEDEKPRSEGGHSQIESYRSSGIDMAGRHLVFRADAPGGTLYSLIEVTEGDRYRFGLVMTHGPVYGRVGLLLDGVAVGEPHDCYEEQNTPGRLVTFGSLHLTTGTHEFGFRILEGDTARRTLGLDAYSLVVQRQFAREYFVAGPFDASEVADFDQRLGMTPRIDLRAEGYRHHWKRVEVGRNGRLNLKRAIKPRRSGKIGYAITHIYARAERPATLFLGFDGKSSLWLNGTLIHQRDSDQKATPDSVRIPCTFHAGWNQVIGRFEYSGGDWDLYLRANDPDGSLRYAADLPDGTSAKP